MSLCSQDRWFYCFHCGREDHDDDCDEWGYVCRYANGESYRCPSCKEESVQ